MRPPRRADAGLQPLPRGAGPAQGHAGARTRAAPLAFPPPEPEKETHDRRGHRRRSSGAGRPARPSTNFPVSGERVPVAVVRWLGRIKGAAARANADLGLLDADLAKRIAAAGDEIADGAHDDQFPIDVFQTGSGTSSNMNANEVIANLAGEGAHPNDHVNMGQSSNDVFPSAVHLAALDDRDQPPAAGARAARGLAGGEGRRVRGHRQVRPHAPDGRRAGHARPGVRRLRRADPPRRARACATRCRRSPRSRSAAPPPAPG